MEQAIMESGRRNLWCGCGILSLGDRKVYKVITCYNAMELVKNTIRVGNSAGVLLPREWLGSQVRVILEPLNLDKEIVEILMRAKILGDVLGAYIVGSYARGEQTIESDIDVLVITGSINKKIKIGKY